MPNNVSPFNEDVRQRAAERGVHPGAVAFEDEQARQARYREAQTPGAFASLMATDEALANSDSARRLVAEYRANPDAYELRGGTLVKKKNSFLNALQNPAVGIPLVFAAAAAPTLLGGLGAGGSSASALQPTLWGAGAGVGEAASAGASLAGAAGGGSMGIGSAIRGGLSWLGDHRDTISSIGSALGDFSQGQASNRGNAFAGQLDLAELLMQREALLGQADRDFNSQSIAREQEGREGRRSAWLDLMRAQRTLSPAQRPNVSPYAAPQRMATDTERAGADAMTAEVMARLQGGNPLPEITRRDVAMPDVDRGLLSASGSERATGMGSALLRILGGYS